MSEPSELRVSTSMSKYSEKGDRDSARFRLSDLPSNECRGLGNREPVSNKMAGIAQQSRCVKPQHTYTCRSHRAVLLAIITTKLHHVYRSTQWRKHRLYVMCARHNLDIARCLWLLSTGDVEIRVLVYSLLFILLAVKYVCITCISCNWKGKLFT